MGKFELVEEFGERGQKISMKKLKTLPECYSPIKKWFGIWRNFTLYSFVSRGHEIVVYRNKKRRFLCTIVQNIEKTSENLYQVTTNTSVYLIKTK